MCKLNRRMRHSVSPVDRLMGLVLGLLLAVVPVAFVAEAAEDDQALLERAGKYWEARVAGTREVLDFYAPPEQGGPKTARDRSEFGNVRYRAAKIQGVEIDGNRAVVKIRITAGLPLAALVPLEKGLWDREIREQWIKFDGTWYKKPIPMGFSSPSANKKSSANKRSNAGASLTLANKMQSKQMGD